MIETNEIHYGDPPNIQCCDSGPTMNSVPIEIIEYWEQIIRPEDIDNDTGVIKNLRNWTRHKELEVKISCSWNDI